MLIKKSIVKYSAILVPGFIVATSLHAKMFYNDSYRDIRVLGRGNAGVAYVSGGPAAFYNPAGIADFKGVTFSLLDSSVGANQNIVDSFSEISTLTNGDNTISEKFSPFLGKPLSLQGSFFPHLAVPGYMLGYYQYFDSNIEYRNPVYPNIQLSARRDWGLISGGGVSYQNRFFLGASIRYMKRSVLDENLTVASIFGFTTDYLKSLMRKGEAFGLNVGGRYRQNLGSSSWFSLGLAVEDVGHTRFKNDTRDPDPNHQAQKVNAGIAYGAKLPKSNVVLLFDMKELNREELSYSKKIYTGMELTLPAFVIRTGLFQGYWTAGLSTNIFPIFDVDFATYGEELGSAAGLRQSRYWMIGLRAGLDLKQKQKKKQKYSLDHL